MNEMKKITGIDVAVAELCKALEAQRTSVKEALVPYASGAITLDTLKDWKAERARINKERNAVDGERKSLEREWRGKLSPVSDAYKGIVSEYDAALCNIDKQLSEFEEQRKNEKKVQIVETWEQIQIPEELTGWVILADVINDKWLNATYSITDIRKEMQDYIDNLKLSYDSIMGMDSEFREEGIQMLRQTKDFREAVAEMNRMQRVKIQIESRRQIEEAARKKAEEEAREKAQVEAIRAAEEKARAEERAKIQIEEEPKMVEFRLEDTAEGIQFSLEMDMPEYRVIQIMVKEENAEKVLQILRNCEYVEDVWEDKH